MISKLSLHCPLAAKSSRFVMTIGLLAVLCLTFLLVSAFAEEEKEPTLENANTVAEIQAYFSHVIQKAREELHQSAEENEGIITAESGIRYLKSLSEAGIASAEKIIKIAEDKEEKTNAYQMLIQALKQKDQYETMEFAENFRKSLKSEGEDEDEEKEPDADTIAKVIKELQKFESEGKKRLSSLLNELEKDGSYEEIVNNEKFHQFISGLYQVSDLTKEKYDELKKEAFAWINKKLTQNDPMDGLSVLIEMGSAQLSEEYPKIAEDTIKEIAAYVKFDACTLPEEEKEDIVLQIEGLQKRAVGAELNLYGKTLDDKDFDWKALRGKYVLVKFTATWCGPCKGEIPGMLEAYKKYHDKGFEIVSVYVWDQLSSVKEAVKEEKLPWLFVSEELTQKAGLPPQGKAYAIDGVPTMLMVDKEGKVISTSVRGAGLEKLLQELLEGK